MGNWSFQGLELRADESPKVMLARLQRLGAGLGFDAAFTAFSEFRAPIVRGNPPHRHDCYGAKGQPVRFVHLGWVGDDAGAWSILYHVALRERRAILSSFSGVGFYARDVDRDGHPRETVLLSCFLGDAQDFDPPLTFIEAIDRQRYEAERRARLAEAAEALVAAGAPRERVERAHRLALDPRSVRFDRGWFLKDGSWQARYLVRDDELAAMASAQRPLCSCAGRHAGMLDILSPCDDCIHYLAARLVDAVAERFIAAEARAGED